MKQYFDPIFKKALDAVPAHTKREVSLAFSISNRIQAALDYSGRTQADLARLTGRKRPEVSRWLSGTQNFTLRTLALIEDALGCDLISVSKAKPKKAQQLKK